MKALAPEVIDAIKLLELRPPPARELPDRLGPLILVALADLRLVEKDKHYRINMNGWHHPVRYWANEDQDGPPDYCSVCLAGAVMAKTMGLPWTTNASPINCCEGDDHYKLEALDYARMGEVNRALYLMRRSRHDASPLPANAPSIRIIEPYQINREHFHRDMTALAAELMALGL